MLGITEADLAHAWKPFEDFSRMIFPVVIPAKAGIQRLGATKAKALGSRLRGNDDPGRVHLDEFQTGHGLGHEAGQEYYE